MKTYTTIEECIICGKEFNAKHNTKKNTVEACCSKKCREEYITHDYDD